MTLPILEAWAHKTREQAFGSRLSGRLDMLELLTDFMARAFFLLLSQQSISYISQATNWLAGSRNPLQGPWHANPEEGFTSGIELVF